MDNLNTFVPPNGLTANVQAARWLIEQENRRLSGLQNSKDRLIQLRTARELQIRSTANTQRDELQRRVAAVDDWEKGHMEQLSAAFEKAKAPLDERINLLNANIDAAKAAIAPIRTLPAELLANVFCEFVGLDEPPCVLALVSKSWRQTALTTPWLWRNLHVTGVLAYYVPRCSWRVGGRTYYTTGSRLVCYSIEDLRFWADKSGKVPLDVELSISRAGQDGDLLQYLLGEQLSSRIQTLSISLSIPKLDAEGLSIGRFPLLYNFSVQSQYHNAAEPLITSILTRSSRVDEFKSQSPLSDLLPGHRFWNSVRVLSLCMGEYSRIQLNQIIGALTVVETIIGLPDNWPDMTTPGTTLKYVKHISVRCRPECLARLRLPQLETLELRDPNSSSYGYEDTRPLSDQLDRFWQLPMPKLVKLTIVSTDATWLSRLSAPALRTMTWDRLEGPRAPQTAFPQIQFPNVETFSFDAYCSDEILRSAIDCVPNVQDLSLGPGIRKGWPDKWVLDLLERLLSGADFPRLRRLTLGNVKHRVGTNKSLAKPLIKGVIRSRKYKGTPIEHLKVAWTKRNRGLETIQYVN